MQDSELAFASAWDLRGLIDSRQVSIVQLTETFLRRIEALNPRLNAYLTVAGEEAMAAATSSQEKLLRGELDGPLHGISISIKDLEVTRGLRTTMGSLIFEDYVPDQDSIVAERVRRAGAIILGKTNTPEFGFSGTTENRLGDACRNPWNTERTSGGSSGGAGAAVAAGLCTLATGSDGGGSIRIPSSFCGIYGMKPTQGRVPHYGGIGRPAYNPFAQSGPIARTVRDGALLLQVLSGPDDRDPTCIRHQSPDILADLGKGVRGLRIAWSPDLGYAAVEPEIVDVTARAALLFEEMGATVEQPEVSLEDPFPPFWDLFAANGYTAYGHLLDDRGEQLTDYARHALDHGRELTAADYSRALARVVRLQARLEAVLEEYDLMLTPTMAVTAFPVGQHPSVIGGNPVDPFWGFNPFAFPFNMSQQTAASIPCGLSSHGLPIGLQIVGPRGGEAMVLRASAAFEGAHSWVAIRPPGS